MDDLLDDEGHLDDAVLQGTAEDGDLESLMALANAADPTLRAAARRVARRMAMRFDTGIAATETGVSRLVERRAHRHEGDVLVDASLDALVAARAAGRAVALDELAVTAWAAARTHICLLVDRSGSMGGERLATASIIAAGVVGAAQRHPRLESSVVAFAAERLVLSEPSAADRPASAVIDDLLTLRGGGATNLAAAGVAAEVLHRRSNAHHRVTLVLSDAAANEGGDPIGVFRRLERLGPVGVIAPADSSDAAEFARRIGAPLAFFATPHDAALALSHMVAELERR